MTVRGKIKNGNDQPGGSSYIGIAMFEKQLGIKVTRVSYPGYGATVTALMAGEIDSGTVPVPDTIEQHKAGKLKLIGVSATARHFMAPDVPTFREQCFDVVVGSWRCIIAPKGVPADRLAFLESNILATLKDPEFLAEAQKTHLTVGPLPGAELQKLVGEVAGLSPDMLEKVRAAYATPK